MTDPSAAPVARSTQQEAERTTIVSAVVNVLLSSAQIVIGLIAQSQALVADGIHSLSDLVADGVVIVANRGSQAAPDDNHQYGHWRYENAASLFLGVLLLAVGVGMLWRGIARIQNADLIPTAHVSALWAALVALVVKESLFRYMLGRAKRIGSSLLVANAWHARSDAASSLVVAVGIGGNLLGYAILDPLAAMAVGFMVSRMGWVFGWNALNDLMDRALPADEVRQLRATLSGTPGVLNVHDLRTRRMGDHAIVDAHLEVSPRISVSEGHYIASSARQRIQATHASLFVQIHIDPREHITTSEHQLPFRNEILPILEHAAPSLHAARHHLTLHYLDGALAIELLLDTPLAPGDEARLRERLASHYGAAVSLDIGMLAPRG